MQLEHVGLPAGAFGGGAAGVLVGGEGLLLEDEVAHGVGAGDLGAALAVQELAQFLDAVAAQGVGVGALVEGVAAADVVGVLPGAVGAGAGLALALFFEQEPLHLGLPVVLELGVGLGVGPEVPHGLQAVGAAHDLLAEDAAEEGGLRLGEAQEGDVAREVETRDLAAAGAAEGGLRARPVRGRVDGSRVRVRGARGRRHLDEEGERAGVRPVGLGVVGGAGRGAVGEAALALGEARLQE